MSAFSLIVPTPAPSPFPRSANSDTTVPNDPLPPMHQNASNCITPKPTEAPQPQPKSKVKENQDGHPVAPSPSPHSPTSPSPHAFALGPLHEKAILLLLRGHSESAIAKALNINRTTLYRWRSCNPLFQAELNRMRQQLWQTDLENLRGLLSRSLRILKKYMRSKDPALQLRAATAMLSHAAPTDLAPPLLPTEPDDLVDMHFRHLRPLLNRKALPDDPITNNERMKTISKLEDLLTQESFPALAASPSANSDLTPSQPASASPSPPPSHTAAPSKASHLQSDAATPTKC